MEQAVIVSTARTAIGRAGRGALRSTRPDDLAAVVLRAVLQRAGGFDPAAVDDVILGCAFPEAEQGTNLARVVLLRAGLPVTVPGMTLNRFCASGLQSIAQACERIGAGGAQAIVAGGVESMSLLPAAGHAFRPNHVLAAQRPEAYIAMGLTAERVADRYDVTRADQDAFALESHQRAVAAQQAGIFAEEIVPVEVRAVAARVEGGTLVSEEAFTVDEAVRPDTSLKALAALRPIFRRGGCVTAGNACPSSDGAAAALVMSASRASELGLRPLGRLLSYAVVGVPPEVMGMGPVEAIPVALQRAGVALADIDLFEINEAFAAQVLPVVRKLGIRTDKLNVNGGAIALGHPLGATGARLTGTLLGELARRELRYGVVSMCIGGGMGAAGVFERIVD